MYDLYTVKVNSHSYNMLYVMFIAV